MFKLLEIHNFRSCAETTLTLDTPVSALVGRNGVGKTNILHAIEWASKAILGPEPVKLGFYQRSQQGIRISIQLEVEARQYHHVFEFRPSDEQTERANGNRLHETLSLVGDQAHQLIMTRDAENVALNGGKTKIRIGSSTPAIGALSSLLPQSDPLHDHFRSLRGFYSSVTYYPLDRPSGNTDLVLESQYKSWRASYLSEGTLPDSVLLRLLHMWLEDRPLFEEFCSIVGPQGLGLIDSFDVSSSESKSKDGSAPEESRDFAYYLLFAPSANIGGSGQFFWFSELSAGTQRIIRMIASMLFDQRSVMLIEQPEDSIHPGLLRKLLDIFRSYSDRTQIVFSTHSPEVLNMLNPHELRLVTAPDGQTQVRSLTEDETEIAQQFLQNEGALSGYYETFDEDQE